MLIDGRQIAIGSNVESTVCIIGGGAAGITVAVELARRGHDTVVLEAGGLRRSGRYQETLSGEVSSSELDETSTHPPLDRVRVRKLGGTTGAWGGRCVPLDPIDFEHREHVDHSGWPIPGESLDPYYRRAATYCQVGAPEYSIAEASPGAAPYLRSGAWSSEVTDSKLLRFSPPTDFWRTNRERLEASKVTRVIHHANVLRLELDDTGQRVEWVLAASSPGRGFRVKARLFVIASGGLETTRLLLVSARSSQKQTGAGYKHIGHYYMTHLDGAVGELRFKTRAPRPAYAYDVSRDGVYCRRLLCLTDDAQRRHHVLNFSSVLHIPSADDPSHGDGLLSLFALTKDAMYRARVGFKSRRHGIRASQQIEYAQHLGNIARDPWRIPLFGFRWVSRRSLAHRKLPSFLVESRSGRYRFLFSAEQSPSFTNRVELSDRWDAFGVPQLRVSWGVKEEDHRSVLTNLDVIARAFRGSGSAEVDIPGSVDQLVEEIGGGFLGGTHAMGTTRMAVSPREGVVDEGCKVHGIVNLFIASSSVFPTSGFAAPTLTIVALSIRLADSIRARL